MTQEAWLALYELAEEQGGHTGDEPPSKMHDMRAAAAPLALKVNWSTLFSYCFFTGGKHTNLLELGSLISVLRRIAREGIRARRLLVLVGWRVVLRDRHKRTIELTENQFLALKTWDLSFSLLTKLPPASTAVFASAHALSELILLPEPLSVAAHKVGENVRELESSGAFSGSKANPAPVVSGTSQVTNAGESIPGLRMCGCCLETVSKTSGKIRKQKELLTAPSHHAGLAIIPPLLLQAGSVRRGGWLCPRGAGPDYWRNELLYRGG